MDKYTAEHLLGLNGSYDLAALKVAYRSCATKYHPDAVEARGGDRAQATAKMQEINEANDYLAKLFNGGITKISCDLYPGGHRTQESARAPYNPFDGRYGTGDPRRSQEARRQTTAEYYANDPRFKDYTRRRHEAQEARRNGSAETLGRKGVVIEDDPNRPNPGWYAPVYRFFGVFPYRLTFLILVCLLVSLTDPLNMWRTLGPLRFEDVLIFLALFNLVYPIATAPVRAFLLWLVDRARDLAWALRGMSRHPKA